MQAAEILDEEDNPHKAAALELVACGFHVFAVQKGKKCPDPLLALNGHHDATTDAETVAGWFDAKPSANIGIACGQEHGLVVLDVDIKNNAQGMASYAALELGDVATLTARTPSGGYHLYFKYPPGAALKAKHPDYPGIDVKGGGAGGYVVAPPSTLAGGAYRWLDPEMPVAAMPAALVAALAAPPEKPRPAKPGAASPTDALRTGEGDRHARLLQLAGGYRAKGLEADDVEALLWWHAEHYFDPVFSRSNAAEVREIEQLAHWIGHKPGAEHGDEELILLTGAELAAHARALPTAWVAEPVLPARGGMMVFGPTGHGKSHLALAFALALARGQSFLDWRVERPHRVLYVDGEMPTAVLYERATRYLCGAPLPDTLTWLCEAAQTGVMPNLANEVAQRHYLAAAERCGAEMVFFDNLTCLRQTTSEAPENSVEAFQPVLRLFKKLARQGAAAGLLHHAGKAGQQRGSSAHGQPFDAVLKISLTKEHDPLAELDVALEFEKARWFQIGPPQRAMVHTDDEADFERWTLCPHTDDLAARTAVMIREGRSQRAIAKALGRSRRGIQKAVLRAQARGLLNLGEGCAG